MYIEGNMVIFDNDLNELPQKGFFNFLSTTIALLAVIANFIILLLCMRFRNLRTVPTVFFTSLAAANTIIALLITPLVLYNSYTKFNFERQFLLTQIMAFSFMLLLLIMTSASYNRYLQLWKLHYYNEYMNIYLTSTVLCLPWLLSLTLFLVLQFATECILARAVSLIGLLLLVGSVTLIALILLNRKTHARTKQINKTILTDNQRFSIIVINVKHLKVIKAIVSIILGCNLPLFGHIVITAAGLASNNKLLVTYHGNLLLIIEVIYLACVFAMLLIPILLLKKQKRFKGAFRKVYSRRSAISPTAKSAYIKK